MSKEKKGNTKEEVKELPEQIEEQQLTEEEKEVLKSYLGVGSPVPEEKHNVHSFLYKIATSDDTTKTGFLKDEEVGTPQLTVRGLKDMSLISDKIMRNNFFSEYYKAKAEIISSTSLSRRGFLSKLAVLQKREIADVTEEKERKQNKGWFKPKNKTGAEEVDLNQSP